MAYLKKHLLGGKSLEKERTSSKIKEKVWGLGALFGEKSLQECSWKDPSSFSNWKFQCHKSKYVWISLSEDYF